MSCRLNPDWEQRAEWNRGAAQVQAERAMRAEEKVDSLISTIASMSRENSELRERVKQLEEELREIGVRF